MLTFAYFSGWRRQEIERLTWAEVDLTNGVIRLDPSRVKTKKPRAALPLVGPLLEVIQRRVKARRLDCVYVFHVNGAKLVDWRMTWTKACVAAGLSTIVNGKEVHTRTLHDCRRTAARNLVEGAGVSEATAMQFTGHQSRSVFERYHIVNQKNVRDAGEALVEHVNEQPVEAVVVPMPRRIRA